MPFVLTALSSSLLVLVELACPSRAIAQPSPDSPKPVDAIKSIAPDPQEPPLMRSDRPVYCVPDRDGAIWRIQCDEDSKICLFAQNKELDSRGKPVKSLERATHCAPNVELSREALKAKGYRLVFGRADVPYGWTRDDRGRIFQINFDLRRRLYLGAAYAPILAQGIGGQDQTAKKRMSIDFGLFRYEYWGGESHPTRHRLRLVEGEISIDPFSANVALVRYDSSHRFHRPLLRLTTFFGKPRRHDVFANIGVWFEAMRIESHQNEVADSSLWKFGNLQTTVDLWQSSNLDSFFRLRSGLVFERLYSSDGGGGNETNRFALAWASVVELDTIIDRAGFHNISAQASYEIPRYFDRQPQVGRLGRRMRGEAAYEVVVLAINDQPITARLAVTAERRNDIPGLDDQWSLSAAAGLRFSLWAPPRQP